MGPEKATADQGMTRHYSLFSIENSIFFLPLQGEKTERTRTDSVSTPTHSAVNSTVPSPVHPEPTPAFDFPSESAKDK